MPSCRSSLTGQELEGDLDSTRLVRNTGHAQPHLDAAQRPRQGQVVEVTEVADPEDPTLELSEPSP